jgi:Helix-turn-helix domain of resolvase
MDSGLMPRPPIPVRAGERYGRLTVIADREGKSPRVWLRCDCGSPAKLVPVGELQRRTEPLRSCGCATREAVRRNVPRTSLPGERNPAAKLTRRRVRAIRRRLAAGEPQRVVAKRFGISRSQLQRIWRGESWTHVE